MSSFCKLSSGNPTRARRPFSVSQSTIRGGEEEKDEEGVKFMRRPKRHIFFLISELTVKLVELILKADVQCEPYDQ